MTEIGEFERGYAAAYNNERPTLRRLFFVLGFVLGLCVGLLI
jgi:hypothetical protein